MTIDHARLLDVHRRLAEGDPTASADLIEQLYGPLTGHALKKHAKYGVDEDTGKDLALEALVAVIEQPHRFDPSRGNLFGYLCMTLDGDARNRRRDEANRGELFSAYAVETEDVGGNSYVTSPEIGIDAKRIMKLHADKIASEDGDRAVLELFLAEEGDYAVYAEALGIGDWPLEERNAEVKRRRDRIEKRLGRLRDKL
jgi:DNA-directed RNA polymerase specialized sigma24 family protein